MALTPQGRADLTHLTGGEHAFLLKRLWAGETVTYDGPAGTYDAITLDDRYHGPAPQIWTANSWRPGGGQPARQAAAPRGG